MIVEPGKRTELADFSVRAVSLANIAKKCDRKFFFNCPGRALHAWIESLGGERWIRAIVKESLCYYHGALEYAMYAIPVPVSKGFNLKS